MTSSVNPESTTKISVVDMTRLVVIVTILFLFCFFPRFTELKQQKVKIYSIYNNSLFINNNLFVFTIILFVLLTTTYCLFSLFTITFCLLVLIRKIIYNDKNISKVTSSAISTMSKKVFKMQRKLFRNFRISVFDFNMLCLSGSDGNYIC